MGLDFGTYHLTIWVLGPSRQNGLCGDYDQGLHRSHGSIPTFPTKHQESAARSIPDETLCFRALPAVGSTISAAILLALRALSLRIEHLVFHVFRSGTRIKRC